MSLVNQWTRRTVLASQQVLTYGHTGQSMVEYAIVVALIALVAMVTVQLLGVGISQVFQNILARIQGLVT